MMYYSRYACSDDGSSAGELPIGDSNERCRMSQAWRPMQLSFMGQQSSHMWNLLFSLCFLKYLPIGIVICLHSSADAPDAEQNIVWEPITYERMRAIEKT